MAKRGGRPGGSWRKALAIPASKRAILCLDGGGIRGIMTIQLLKRLEEIAQKPCHEIFDMVAGTSTGGIIAGLIAAGKTALEIESLYSKFVKLVFTERLLGNRFINPPEYTKKNYRDILRTELSNVTLLDVCTQNDIDLLITANDVAEGEETYFACKRDNAGTSTDRYKDVLLRAAMEATMSAPTYFTPLERLVDGGVTTYNNPSLAAITEAVRYGPPGKYAAEQLVVLSFGTGYRQQLIAADEVPDPPGPDAMFWLQWIMSEAGADASDMQSYFLRSGACAGIDYRRFQISLDHTAINKLPDQPLQHDDNTPAQSIHQLTDPELAAIELDDVKHFDVMRAIGAGFVAYLDQETGYPPFTRDLIDPQTKKELLVTRSGNTDTIASQMSDPNWLDHYQD